MQKVAKIWMDGKLVNWEDATVHVLTHTLHYGWGVFEGIRCYRYGDGSSAIFRLDEHVSRLFNSAHIMGFEIPFSKDEIKKGIIDTLKANDLKEAYIRPIAFVGDGEMGIYVNNPIRVAIAAYPWGAYLGEEGLKSGIRVKVSSYNRFHVNNIMTKAKACGHYVNSVLAKREVKALGYDEAVMLDTEGYVSEASGENIFIVRNGVLKTTPLTSVLEGITRDAVIRIAEDKGIRVKEERFTRDELYIAEEAFFTGTAAEVTPIREVDGRRIGEGRPGDVTRSIQKEFFDIVKGENTKYRRWLTTI
jgi:branched-chain amino acid aminotransferase